MPLVRAGLLALIALLTACSHLDIRTNQHAMPDRPPTRLVYVGDSITDGGTYALLIDQALREAGREPFHFFNAGVASDKASDILARLDRDVLVYHPDLVTLSVGINDVMQGVSQDTYERDVTAILDRLRAAGINVIVMTTTVIGPKHAAKQPALNGYNAFLRAAAQRRGLRVADVHETMARADANGLEGDQIHLNFAGYRLMARALLDAMGHAAVPVPDEQQIDLYPGVIREWKLAARPGKRVEPLTADAVAVLTPDDSWIDWHLPETEPLEDWWNEQLRHQGFAQAFSARLPEATHFLGHRVIVSQRPRTAFLNTGGQLNALWLNGECVYRNEGWTGFHPGKERLPVKLRAGANVIVIETNSRFFLSLTDTDDWSG